MSLGYDVVLYVCTVYDVSLVVFFLLLLVSLPELRQNIERTSSHDSQFDASGSTRCRAVPRSRTTDL